MALFFQWTTNRTGQTGNCRDDFAGVAVHSRRRKWVIVSYKALRMAERYLPPYVRGLLGVLLVFLGMLGFLPILGFWMIPLGVVLLATDIPPLRRRLMDWLHKHRTICKERRDA